MLFFKKKRPFVGDPINPTVNVADRLIQYPELLRALANAISYGKDALKKNHRELPTDKPAAISPVSAPSTPGAKSVVQTMPTSSSTLASASKPASAVAVSVPVRNPPPAPSRTFSRKLKIKSTVHVYLLVFPAHG